MKNEKIKGKGKNKTVDVPVVRLRMMSDEEWNRLAYKNYLKRSGSA